MFFVKKFSKYIFFWGFLWYNMPERMVGEMGKKLLLSSAVVMLSLAHAWADPVAGTWDDVNGNMDENTVYANAATYNHTGVYSGTASVQAYFEWAMHNIAAGTYWPASTEWDDTVNPNPAVVQCPVDYFCPGVSNVHYETFDQGKTACSTLENGTYPNSAAGATANTDCYRPCTTAIANIAHAATVTGNDYYGGVKTCKAIACENGYHTYQGLEYIQNVRGQYVDTGVAAKDVYGYEIKFTLLRVGGELFGARDTACTGCGIYFAPKLSAGTMAVDYLGVRWEVSSPVQLNVPYKAVLQNNVFSLYNEETNELIASHTFSSINRNQNSSVVIFGLHSNGSYSPSNPAQIRGVKIYASNNDMSHNFVPVARAGVAGLYDTVTDTFLANTANTGSFSQGPLTGSNVGKSDSCEPNIITINWGGADAADIAANNADTTVYGGDIRTPTKAVAVPGKVFTGWRFIDPNANQNQE